MVKLEEIDQSIVRPEDSPQTQSESIRGHNQTGSDVWKRMLGDESEQQEEDCYTTEMRMPRGILGVTGRDDMRNGDIRRISHVSPIDEVMLSGRLRWCGHVQRRDENNVTHRVKDLTIPGTRRRGRPRRHGTKR